MNRPVFMDFERRWAISGLEDLTGHAGEAVLPKRDFLARLDELSGRVEELGERFGVALGLDHSVFMGRAAILGLTRRGQTSCNGTCRLIESGDGWLAVNLARPEDVDLVPAWLCRKGDDPWKAIGKTARRCSTADLIERAAMLGMPVAAIPFSRHPGEGRDTDLSSQKRRLSRLDPGLRQDDGLEGGRRPVVVDLSSLWAGPLCGHLLTRIGCRVIKVESTTRPDGARFGPATFFEELHNGQEFVTVDFATPDRLRDLILSADVVIEGSRPRALRQLGIDRDEVMSQRPSMTWVSITAHGRDDARVGFGDDAAAAAGLLAWDRAGRPVFVGDAIADPIAGLTAAEGAMASLLEGGGHTIDVSLSGAAAWVADAPEIASW